MPTHLSEVEVAWIIMIYARSKWRHIFHIDKKVFHAALMEAGKTKSEAEFTAWAWEKHGLLKTHTKNPSEWRFDAQPEHMRYYERQGGNYERFVLHHSDHAALPGRRSAAETFDPPPD